MLFEDLRKFVPTKTSTIYSTRLCLHCSVCVDVKAKWVGSTIELWLTLIELLLVATSAYFLYNIVHYTYGMPIKPHVHGCCLIPHDHTQCSKITQMPATLCTLNEVAQTPTLIAL